MQPGSQLANGRFTLEQQITRSGMAEVWIARQQVGGGMSKPVVIKMIHPDLNAQQEARQRFFDEARFMSQIHHAHVVQFYDFGEEEDDLLFQVMEYIEGFAIEQIITRSRELSHPLPIPMVCRLVADACKGLGYIHDLKDERGISMGLVHRDISPQNLLVSKSGSIKIIDFGIVKAREKSSRTRTGVIVGKLQYMSPEQLSSEDLDCRSDLYSLGLVLYELLTLERRFRGSNLLEVFYEALNEPPPAVVDLRPDCPPEIVQALHGALAQDPDQRYANAYQFQEALEGYLHRQGVLMAERQIASFMEDLFAGNEHLSEETTQIHAASLLGAMGFGEDPAEATVAALASDILHGGAPHPLFDPMDAEGTFQAAPGFADFAVLQGQQDMNASYASHTMSNYSPQSPAPGYLGSSIDSHTLSPHAHVNDYNTMDQLTPPRRGIEHDNADPTRLNTVMPPIEELLASAAPATPPPLSAHTMQSDFPPPPVVPPTPSPTVPEASVMLSPGLVEEAGGDIQQYSASYRVPASTQRVPGKKSKPAKAVSTAASNQGFLSISKGNWIILILSFAVIGVFGAWLLLFLMR